MRIAAERGKSNYCGKVWLGALRKMLSVLVALLALITLSMACSKNSANSDTSTSIELEEALASGKPTLAGFVGEECACKNMRPTLEELAVEYDGRCNVVIIDVSEDKDLAGQYGIMLTPTQVFLDSSGAEVERMVGSSTREEMIERLDRMGVVKSE